MDEKLSSIIKRPKELIGGAISALKGPDVEGLMEHFTDEMTLVAEGLYDDQMRLRKEVEDISAQQTILSQQVLDGREEMLAKLDQQQRELAARLNDMQKRMQALESHKSKQSKKNGWLSQVTVLAAIVAGAWVIVTLLNLLK